MTRCDPKIASEIKTRTILDNPPVRVKTCRYGTMMYLANDAYIGRSLDLYGEFSEGESRLFAQLIRPGMAVLDIGANIGAHSIYLSKLVSPNGQVTVFEPQRTLFHILCGNLALNQVSNTVAFNAAVGSAHGTIHVPRLDYTKGANFGGLSLGEWEQGDVVQVLTLDSLAFKRCSFIKIDVEGMELEVLHGAMKTLSKHKPLLYVENDRAEKSAALIEWLLAHKYRPYWHLPKLFNPDNYYQVKENVFGGILSINMLCVPMGLDLTIHGMREILSPDDNWRMHG